MLNYLNNNLSSEIIAIINHFYAVSICIFIIYLFLLWMAEVNNSASGSQTSLPTSPNSSGADPEDPEEKKRKDAEKKKLQEEEWRRRLKIAVITACTAVTVIAVWWYWQDISLAAQAASTYIGTHCFANAKQTPESTEKPNSEEKNGSEKKEGTNEKNTKESQKDSDTNRDRTESKEAQSDSNKDTNNNKVKPNYYSKRNLKTVITNYHTIYGNVGTSIQSNSNLKPDISSDMDTIYQDSSKENEYEKQKKK